MVFINKGFEDSRILVNRIKRLAIKMQNILLFFDFHLTPGILEPSNP